MYTVLSSIGHYPADDISMFVMFFSGWRGNVGMLWGDLHQRFLEYKILVTKQPLPPAFKPVKWGGVNFFNPADPETLNVLNWHQIRLPTKTLWQQSTKSIFGSRLKKIRSVPPINRKPLVTTFFLSHAELRSFRTPLGSGPTRLFWFHWDWN